MGHESEETEVRPCVMRVHNLDWKDGIAAGM